MTATRPPPCPSSAPYVRPGSEGIIRALRAVCALAGAMQSVLARLRAAASALSTACFRSRADRQAAQRLDAPATLLH
jgi:hypothetical protein